MGHLEDTKMRTDYILKIFDGNSIFQGNGFVFRDGYAITCAHVLRDGGTHAKIDGKLSEFEVVKNFSELMDDDMHDYIILYENNKECVDFALIASPEFKIKQPIIAHLKSIPSDTPLCIPAYGHSEEPTVFMGSCKNRKINNVINQNILCISNDNYPKHGNSGAPVVNENNEIIGIFRGMHKRGGQDTNEFVYIEIKYIYAQLEKYLN